MPKHLLGVHNFLHKKFEVTKTLHSTASSCLVTKGQFNGELNQNYNLPKHILEMKEERKPQRGMLQANYIKASMFSSQYNSSSLQLE